MLVAFLGAETTSWLQNWIWGETQGDKGRLLHWTSHLQSWEDWRGGSIADKASHPTAPGSPGEHRDDVGSRRWKFRGFHHLGGLQIRCNHPPVDHNRDPGERGLERIKAELEGDPGKPGGRAEAGSMPSLSCRGVAELCTLPAIWPWTDLPCLSHNFLLCKTRIIIVCIT